MRTGPTILALMFSTTLVAAQNAPTAPAQAVKSAHLKEKLLAVNQERMCWEASQTWSIPALREPDSAEHRSVHVDAHDQRPPDPPKLRREWLKPSDESKLMGEK